MKTKALDSGLKEKIKYYSCGIFLSIIVTAVFMAGFAALMLFANLDRELAKAFASASLSIGIICGSFFTSYKIGDKGYKTGIIIALIFFVTVSILGFALNDGKFTFNSIFHIVIISLSGEIGGILGVNKKHKHKYI